MSSIEFIDENKTKAKIKVIGVGGCGGNAASEMLKTSLAGEVGIYAVNTDNQALDSIDSNCERIQIGQQVAKGLGVGADYEKARQAAQHDRERLEEIVDGADMIFIAAGMGGGTGTGAAPVIAEICKEKSILTVAVVTKPFTWEGEGRARNAKAGIQMLSGVTDSIIIVPNDRICEVYGDDLMFTDAFKYSDDILSNAVSGICEIIYRAGRINVDFADVKTVMSEMGQAMMGTAQESGIDRAARVAKNVIDCPLLEGIKLERARGILVNITTNASNNFKMQELNEIMSIIRKTATDESKIFFGFVDDPSMDDSIRVTLVATGLNAPPQANNGPSVSAQRIKAVPENTGLVRNQRGFNANSNQGNLLNNDDQIPAMLRKQHN